MRKKGKALKPARVVAPGSLVRKELVARGWTQEDLAKIMGRPVQAVSEIISGKKQITPETALGLADAFGTSAEIWLGMESAYRLNLARQSGLTDDVKRRGRIYSIVPVKELVRRGWIPDSDSVDELESHIESFFGVDSLNELPPQRLAARRTASKEPDSRGLLAWTRRVEQIAVAQTVGNFKAAGLPKVVDELLSLTIRDDGPLSVGEILRSAGVCFVIVPHLQQTYFDGAVVSANGNPTIALTLRYDRLDSFWFTLMHEMAHLVRGHGGARIEDLDGDAGENSEETEADSLAAEWLVPGESVDRFVSDVKPYFSRQAIWSFAESIGRHPAIVLGRLQHDGHVSQAHLRGSIPGMRRMLEPWTDVAVPIETSKQPSGAVSVAEPDSIYDPEGAVLEWIRSQSGWVRPAEVKRALNLNRSVWSRTIRSLVEAEIVEQKGQRRGAMYRAADR